MIQRTKTRFVWLVSLLIFSLWFSAPSVADQRDSRLEDLFAALASATNPQEAAQLESKIWLIWGETGQREIDDLFVRGGVAMSNGDMDKAVELFSLIIKMRPNFAEAWNKRATVFYLQRKLSESVADIEKTLALEPRHFGAISGLGLIFMAQEDARGALKAFEQVLEIHPQSSSARINVEWLRKQLDITGA